MCQQSTEGRLLVQMCLFTNVIYKYENKKHSIHSKKKNQIKSKNSLHLQLIRGNFMILFFNKPFFLYNWIELISVYASRCESNRELRNTTCTFALATLQSFNGGRSDTLKSPAKDADLLFLSLNLFFLITWVVSFLCYLHTTPSEVWRRFVQSGSSKIRNGCGISRAVHRDKEIQSAILPTRPHCSWTHAYQIRSRRGKEKLTWSTLKRWTLDGADSYATAACCSTHDDENIQNQQKESKQ